MKKYLPLILKILVVCTVLSLILIAILVNIKNQKNNGITNQKKVENQVIKQLTQEELTANYKSSVLESLNSFSGNYQETRNKLVSIAGVPIEFKNLHFDMVVALDYLVFKDDKDSSKQRLEKIYKDYDWLKPQLSKIIQSIQ